MTTKETKITRNRLSAMVSDNDEWVVVGGTSAPFFGRLCVIEITTTPKCIQVTAKKPLGMSCYWALPGDNITMPNDWTVLIHETYLLHKQRSELEIELDPDGGKFQYVEAVRVALKLENASLRWDAEGKALEEALASLACQRAKAIESDIRAMALLAQFVGRQIQSVVVMNGSIHVYTEQDYEGNCSEIVIDIANGTLVVNDTPLARVEAALRA